MVVATLGPSVALGVDSAVKRPIPLNSRRVGVRPTADCQRAPLTLKRTLERYRRGYSLGMNPQSRPMLALPRAGHGAQFGHDSDLRDKVTTYSRSTRSVIIKSVVLLLAGLLCLAIPVAVSDRIIEDPQIRDAILVGAILGLGALYLFDLRRERRRAREALEAAGRRFSDLIRAAQDDRFELQVFGSRMLRKASIGALAGGTFVFLVFVMPESQRLGWFSLAVIFLLPSLVTLILGIPGIGKPVLSLSRKGFSTPWAGEIAWQLVDYIKLDELHQMSLHLYMLYFDIPRLREISQQFRLPHRWIYRVRSRVSAKVGVALEETSENRQVVLRIAQLLRRSALSGTIDDPSLTLD